MLNAYAQGPVTAQAQGNSIMTFLPIIIIFIVFYFLLIKPQKKQQEEHKKMTESLKKNDEVITSSGIHGTIVNVKNDTFVVRIDDNVKVEIQKSHIGTLKKRHEKGENPVT